jgi:hypothetical protein
MHQDTNSDIMLERRELNKVSDSLHRELLQFVDMKDN